MIVSVAPMETMTHPVTASRLVAACWKVYAKRVPHIAYVMFRAIAFATPILRIEWYQTAYEYPPTTPATMIGR
jgi:hypothetical protein